MIAPPAPAARPDITTAVTRGAASFLMDAGYAVVREMRLANGRRADLMGIDRKGQFAVIEVKSCRADFEIDTKWETYLPFCDAFYFAVPEAFPLDLLPPAEGLLIADGFGAGVVRPPVARPMAPARRKALTIRFARQAACSAIDQLG